MIHKSCEALGERSSLSGAIANPRTETSTATSRVTRTITTRPHHSFIPALGPGSVMVIPTSLHRSAYLTRRAYQVRTCVSRTHRGMGGGAGGAGGAGRGAGTGDAAPRGTRPLRQAGHANSPHPAA